MARVEAVESRNAMVIITLVNFLVIDSAPELLVRFLQVDEVGNKKSR